MEQAEVLQTNVNESNVIVLSRKSWFAYVMFVGILSIFATIVTSIVWRFSTMAGVICLLLFLGFIVIQVLQMRSIYLYVNESGVWIYSGIFPWNKGSSGVKWRDLDEAVYYPTFISWVTRAHTIRIGHRFTKSSEISVFYMNNALKTIEHINKRHQELLRAGVLN